MSNEKHIYFISDFHLGVPDKRQSKIREEKIIRWLREIQKTAQEVYILGDVFDFWFEYKHVVPKGYVSFLAELENFKKLKIPVHIFTGNHDMWMKDYLPEELGIILHKNPIHKKIGNHWFFIGHGDGLGPGDFGYKFIKKVFQNPICQFLFSWIHPDLGIPLANFWSKKSRGAEKSPEKYMGDDKEFLVQYCLKKEKEIEVDFFIFGHRHLALKKQLNKSVYINTGEWISQNHYAVYDGEKTQLLQFG